MTKVIDDYLFEVEKNLAGLPAKERQDVIEFYREYLLDGDFVRRSTIEQELGTPKQLAVKILADYSITDQQTDTSDQRKSSQSNVKAIWYILLGICVAPIGIPLVIVAFGLVLATVCLCLSLFAGALGIFLAMILIGGRVVFKSFGLLFTGDWAVGIFYIGAVLVCLAIVLFLVPLFARLINFLIAECAKVMRHLGKKSFKNNHYQSAKDKQ